MERVVLTFIVQAGVVIVVHIDERELVALLRSYSIATDEHCQVRNGRRRRIGSFVSCVEEACSVLSAYAKVWLFCRTPQLGSLRTRDFSNCCQYEPHTTNLAVKLCIVSFI